MTAPSLLPSPQPPRRLGLLGGTFDPIHNGHLDAADAAAAALHLDSVMVIPSHLPPHRPAEPHASAFHRFALVALAISGRPGLTASDLELTRPGPSYTLTTLQAMHGLGWAPIELFFIIGADAFADISHWHGFPAVLDAAHFVVVDRPGMSRTASLARLAEAGHKIQEPGSPLPGAGTATAIIPLEAKTRDVSSTLIRARLAAGDTIDDLVPAAVAGHIHTHHLYEDGALERGLQ